MINSIESDRLQRLIDRKEASYKKMKEEDPNNQALKYLNSEITFLRDEILPIVLTNTTVDYSEIRDYVTRSMRKLEHRPKIAKHATDLLIHFHMKDTPTLIPKEQTEPIFMAAYFSNIGHDNQFIPELYVNNNQVLCCPL